jgi:hypothetical protein
MPRQQQRLVADIRGFMDRRIDAQRTGEPAAIAARQEKRRFAVFDEQAGNRYRCWCLARAAKCEIANANDRDAGFRFRLSHARGGDGAIDQCDGLQQPGG